MLVSVIIVIVVAAAALLVAFITRGYLTPAYIFNANFIVGVAIIILGLFSLTSPSARMGGGLGSGSRSLDFEMHEKLKKAHRQDEPKIAKFIYTGVGVLLLSMLAQYLLSLILR
jgi:hypothetical protein